MYLKIKSAEVDSRNDCIMLDILDNDNGFDLKTAKIEEIELNKMEERPRSFVARFEIIRAAATFAFQEPRKKDLAKA